MGDGGFITNPDNWSWNPPKPKRTFKIGDLELNSPVRKGEGEYIAKVGGNEYYFTNYHDRNTLEEALRDILRAARDED